MHFLQRVHCINDRESGHNIKRSDEVTCAVYFEWTIGSAYIRCQHITRGTCLMKVIASGDRTASRHRCASCDILWNGTWCVGLSEKFVFWVGSCGLG